jgi:hypothetical protein
MLEEERMLGNDTMDKTWVRKPHDQGRSPMNVQCFPDTSQLLYLDVQILVVQYRQMFLK